MSDNCKNCDNPLCEMAGKEREMVGYFCYGYEAKPPMTNADHIRSMSDIELTFFLNEIVVNHHVKTADNCSHCPLKAAKPCDTEGLIDWLQMPWNEKE